jgi:hypothetical protein
MPLELLDLDFGGIPDPYRHALCIARPDGHVAWRGARSPEDADRLLATLTGGPAAR